MVVKVLGFMKVDIDGSKTKSGRPLKGANIFALEDIQSDYGKGQRYLGRYNNGSYSPIFINENIFPSSDIQVGSTYDIGINLSGYVESVKKI